MSEPRRGHVPNLQLGRYRMLRHAERGAIAAAQELAVLGEVDLAKHARDCARRLNRAAHTLRVTLDDARGS